MAGDSINQPVLVVHIGMPKCGSTSLQAGFSQHSEPGSWWYPKSENPERFANGQSIFSDVTLREIDTKLSEGNLVVLSEEGFYEDIEVIVNRLGLLQSRPRIIYMVVVRPYLELVSSWAGELSKPYHLQAIEHYSPMNFLDILEIACRRANFAISNILEFLRSNSGKTRVFSLDSFHDIIFFFQSLNGTKLSLPLIQNQGTSRKYCEASIISANLLHELQLSQFVDAPNIDDLVMKLNSGDPRSIVYSLQPNELGLIDRFWNDLLAQSSMRDVSLLHLESLVPFLETPSSQTPNLLNFAEKTTNPVDELEVYKYWISRFTQATSDSTTSFN